MACLVQALAGSSQARQHCQMQVSEGSLPDPGGSVQERTKLAHSLQSDTLTCKSC